MKIKLLLCSLILQGCAQLGGVQVGGAAGALPGNAQDLRFNKPPAIGSTVSVDRLDIRCESRIGARFTSATGFYHNDCQPAVDSGTAEWQVIYREYEKLEEGAMWLLRSRNVNGDVTWLVLPWHDWA